MPCVGQAGGCEHSAAVAATSLELADAGIDIIDVPAAAVVGHYLPPGEDEALARLILDPSASELLACTGSTVVSMLPRLGRLTHVAHTGRVPPAAFTAAMRRAMQGCVDVASVLRTAAVDAERKRVKAAGKASKAAASTAISTG